MLLSALLLASAVQAAPPAGLQAASQAALQAGLASAMSAAPGRVTVYASKSEAMEAIRKQAACREKGLQLADQPPPDVRSSVKRLDDLPPANHTLTVLRSVDGCPVSSTIRFNVDRPAGR
jgi:hypothetical protein